MPVTGHDLPIEICETIFAFILASEVNILPTKLTPLVIRPFYKHNVSLVCFRWAKIYRSRLWGGRVICISSLEQAQWFKWIVTRGTGRLESVIDLLGYIDVVQDLSVPRSWLHLLYFTSTRAKLRNLELRGQPTRDGEQMPLHHSTPHWGLSKPLSPSITPYKRITLTGVSFCSLETPSKLLLYFREATEVRLQAVGKREVLADTALLRKTKMAVSTVKCNFKPTSEPYPREEPPVYANLPTFLIARGQTCPLMASSELEQIVVQGMLHGISASLSGFDIRCDNNQLIFKMSDGVVLSILYGTSPQTSREKTVTRVALSIPTHPRRDSQLPSNLALLPSLRELVVNSRNLPTLKGFLGHPAIHRLVNRREMRVRATYSQLNTDKPVSGEQPQVDCYVLVDPHSLQPTGKVLSARQMSSLFQVEDMHEGSKAVLSGVTLYDNLPGASLSETSFWQWLPVRCTELFCGAAFERWSDLDIHTTQKHRSRSDTSRLSEAEESDLRRFAKGLDLEFAEPSCEQPRMCVSMQSELEGRQDCALTTTNIAATVGQ